MKSADDLTLAEAVDLIYYGASCKPCMLTRRINLEEMLQQLGPDFLVRDLLPRLRCTSCDQRKEKNRKVYAVTLWKDSTCAMDMMKHWK